MLQKQPISFTDEKFNLDYLTFNLPNSIERISEIAEIFYRYRFNSKIYDVETEKTTIVLENKSFVHTITFRLGIKEPYSFIFQHTIHGVSTFSSKRVMRIKTVS